MNLKPTTLKIVAAIIVFFISSWFFCSGLVCSLASGIFDLEPMFFPIRLAFALGAYVLLSIF